MCIDIKKKYFTWFQFLHVIHKRKLKENLKIDQGNCRNLLYLNDHLIKTTKFTPLKSSKRMNFFLYRWEILSLPRKNILKIFFQIYLLRGKMFICLSRIVTNNTKLRVFQHAVLNKVLYLKKHLYVFKTSDTKLYILIVIWKMKQVFIRLLTLTKNYFLF